MGMTDLTNRHALEKLIVVMNSDSIAEGVAYICNVCDLPTHPKV